MICCVPLFCLRECRRGGKGGGVKDGEEGWKMVPVDAKDGGAVV